MVGFGFGDGVGLVFGELVVGGEVVDVLIGGGGNDVVGSGDSGVGGGRVTGDLVGLGVGHGVGGVDGP